MRRLAGRFEEPGARGEVVGGLVVWREMVAGEIGDQTGDGGTGSGRGKAMAIAQSFDLALA
jgi:hypothetical protein